MGSRNHNGSNKFYWRDWRGSTCGVGWLKAVGRGSFVPQRHQYSTSRLLTTSAQRSLQSRHRLRVLTPGSATECVTNSHSATDSVSTSLGNFYLRSVNWLSSQEFAGSVVEHRCGTAVAQQRLLPFVRRSPLTAFFSCVIGASTIRCKHYSVPAPSGVRRLVAAFVSI
jgi:hypothetical protein